MNREPRILLFHTAFIGDIILMLPLAQALRVRYSGGTITAVSVPQSAPVLRNHPAIDRVITFDKKGSERGLRGILTLARHLRALRFDMAFVPHRSWRSAVVVWLARIPRRIGFSTSSGRMLFTDVVPYGKTLHEIERNLSLLRPLGTVNVDFQLPELHPRAEDGKVVDGLLRSYRLRWPSFNADNMVAIAPGSVWLTKRWPAESYTTLVQSLVAGGWGVVLIGGPEDQGLCRSIAEAAGKPGTILNTAGAFTLLQSAELLRRCSALVSNDSAPMHLGVAMRTPVVAVYGATIPDFGFAPLGKRDRVVEIEGLACRPCGIHGGNVCPIGTLECLRLISHERVLHAVTEIALDNTRKT
jgi:heptosyltransferase II